MNPSYIYFKELDIDSEDTFGFDFSKSNEIENVILDKDYEYASTGLTLNVEIPEGQVIQIEEKKINQISTKIENLIENYKKLDLTLYIVNTEIFEEKIPFTKKNETELPLKKYTYFDRLTKKSKTVSV